MLKVRGPAAVLAAVPLVAAVPGQAQAAPKPPGKRSVALRTDAPELAIVPGVTRTWAFTAAPKGGKKGERAAYRATFRATLPASLEFVSGKGCEAEGRKVVCDLGKVKAGKKVKGSFRAKISTRAEPGREIVVRGVVTWGKARAARDFPAVRVVEAPRLETATL
ncbi:hypothetical protein BJF79_28840 [Actinomadura sp. CNU-125]|uniref:hypothetical protein n=1 Tax=Actinomadura sp. CNU-125 TaxID=1904961 RepID=UPI00095C5351|nr:hypothetical protein [Actinomadura sp. CNU-125]OLT37861.1 hypothetical protein BJF79_28840 [Actinomadura sp. CNU-125]